MHAHGFNNKTICMHIHVYNACAHTHYSWRSFTMQRDFEGDIIGMSLQKHATTFRGRRDFEVQRDFKEIWHLNVVCDNFDQSHAT